MSGLRSKVKSLESSANKKKKRQDFDPEDDLFTQQAATDEDSEGEESVDEDLGREHYQNVGSSKLRKPGKIQLDQKKYGGQTVSRDKIFQDDDDEDVLAPEEYEDEDPFASRDSKVSGSEGEPSNDEDDLLDGAGVDGEIDEDDEIDSDEALEEGEESKFRAKGFVFRGSGKDLRGLPDGSDEDEEDVMDGISEISETSGSEQSDLDMKSVDDDGDEGSDEYAEESLTDEDEIDEDEQESEGHEISARSQSPTNKQPSTSAREAIKALMSEDTAALASSLSASLSADAKKGTAVKSQYQVFDRLLDARIKLQKGLTASADLPSNMSVTNDEVQNAIQRAEEAALKLYATIESLRHSILEANASTKSASTYDPQPGQKRKRPSLPTPTTTTTDLWNRLTTLESLSIPTRNQTLDKWSFKTRSAAPPISKPTLGSKHDSTTHTPLSTLLPTYLHSPSTTTYDDTTFYQSLLRDLIASRSRITNNTNTTTASTLPTLPLKLHQSGNSRKIDTRASKGRRIRYTVHEKLENFMASEGRGNSVGQWNEGAVREFFASLLGQRGVLGEDDGDVDDEEDRDGDGEGNGDNDSEEGSREIEALRLFRT